METCPCCSYTLLRHIRSNRTFWYCSHCRQEMPNFRTELGRSPQTEPVDRDLVLPRYLFNLYRGNLVLQ